MKPLQWLFYAIMITIIGNPENRRVSFFKEAVVKRGLICQELAYIDILQNPQLLEDTLSKTTFLKIESCGENFDVYKHIIALGAIVQDIYQQPISVKEALKLTFQKGKIGHNRQWFLGYSRLLSQIEQLIEKYQIQIVNHPQAILQMFNKVTTHQLLAQNQIEKTPYLGVIKNYADLVYLMNQHHCPQVFIKLAHGSSASGVMAFRKNKNKQILISSVELVRKQGKKIELYNSLRIRKYTNIIDIIDIIDTLASECLLVEKWLPKATFQGKAFDLRMVVIDGKAEHTVMRTSTSPMTNLHLGNKRGDLELLKKFLGEEKWKTLQEQVIETTQCFSENRVVGVDVLYTTNFKKSVIIEANAFGDLLPNVLNNQGLTTYEQEALLIPS